MVRSSSVVLPGAGGAHQVERGDAALGQPRPVVRGELVVLGQHRDLELERVGAPRRDSRACGCSCPCPCRGRGRARARARGRARAARRTDERHPGLVLAAAAGRAHLRAPPPTSRTARGRTSSSTSALPQPHSRNGSSSVKSRAQVRQCARPCSSTISSDAPSSGVPAVASSKQNDRASGTTPASRPTRRRTTATAGPPVRSSDRGHDALRDRQLVHACSRPSPAR